MAQKAPIFQTKNAHSEKFDQFHNSRLFDRLGNKFQPKPYWKQYRVLHIVALTSGLFFHVFSAGCAAALVYFFILALSENAVLAGLLTLVGLGLLEVAKRFTAEKLFHTYFQFHKIAWGLAGVAVLLAGLSITAAYFGAQKAVHQFAPPPELVTSDSITATLNERLAAVDASIRDVKKNTWKGKLIPWAGKALERLTAQRERIVTALLDREQRVQTQNDATVQTHQVDTKDQGLKFALFVLLSELLLIGCLAYCEYYDYRSYAEHCQTGDDPDGDAPPTPPTPFSANRKERPVSATIPATDTRPPDAPNDSGNPWSAVFDTTANATTTKIVPRTHADENRLRTCEHCAKPYTYAHRKQRFCSDKCRVASWEQRTGRTLRRKS